MRATEIAADLEGFDERGAGTDSERRAARWLVAELSASGREVVVEPFWCRPNWALAHAWHVALALAGSLLTLTSAPVGGALLLLSLLSVVADTFTGVSPGRQLTPERASQNVVAVPSPGGEPGPVRLVLTANYDAGRAGLGYRDAFRRLAGVLRRASRGLAPGWQGWLCLAIVWLLVIAVLRAAGHHSHVVGAAQLPPTIGLVLGLALLIEMATADFSPAAGDNGTGVGVAMVLARALDAAPPGHLDVEVVLEGAGEGGHIGLRRYLRAHRRERSPTNMVVLGIGACSAGTPRWWSSDGSLLPVHYARWLRQLAGKVAADEPHLAAGPHRGRGTAPAWRARMARLPALSIGCLDQRDLVPGSHQRTDLARRVDPAAVDAAVQFGLMLVDGIDASVARARATATPV